MPEPHADPVTLYLQQMQRGDATAVDQLLPFVYEDLRRMAEGFFRRERSDHTLQPTALVHEAYARLVGAAGGWESRRHFLSVAAMAMRQLLSNYAAQRGAQKRGGSTRRVALEEAEQVAAEEGVDLVELSDALAKLERLDPRQARIVELRFFAGLTVEETAEVLGVTERTVYLDWRMARDFLLGELSGGREE
jgi:RNA polymerase sigma factor (TIGR02999 family)